ncbi:MAG: Holliday junction resolvase-like protein [Candidatus Hydrothermarchaeota archaeon]
MFAEILVILLLIVVIYLFLKYSELKDKIEKERENAIKMSEAVIKGKVTEYLIPYFPDFRYNPKDVRFIGTPVDLIVFDGLSEGEVRKVAFVEVKTGKTANLSHREKLVRNCVENKNVAYEVIHQKGNEIV